MTEVSLVEQGRPFDYFLRYLILRPICKPAIRWPVFLRSGLTLNV
jgi:hypothetical protein